MVIVTLPDGDTVTECDTEGDTLTVGDTEPEVEDVVVAEAERVTVMVREAVREAEGETGAERVPLTDRDGDRERVVVTEFVTVGVMLDVVDTEPEVERLLLTVMDSDMEADRVAEMVREAVRVPEGVTEGLGVMVGEAGTVGVPVDVAVSDGVAVSLGDAPLDSDAVAVAVGVVVYPCDGVTVEEAVVVGVPVGVLEVEAVKERDQEGDALGVRVTVRVALGVTQMPAADTVLAAAHSPPSAEVSRHRRSVAMLALLVVPDPSFHWLPIMPPAVRLMAPGTPVSVSPVTAMLPHMSPATLPGVWSLASYSRLMVVVTARGTNTKL